MKKYNIVLIRALACIAVILYHMNNMMFGIGGTTSSLLAIGGIAPEFFCVISGFLVSVKKDVGDIKTYYVKRILRICPVYYLVIVYNIFFWGILLNWNWPVDSSGMYWWRYFLFLSTTVPTGEGLWINVNATWTISAFMFFYLINPLTHFIKNKSAKVFAAILVVSVFIQTFYDQYVYLNAFPSPISCLPYFLIGMLARIYVDEEEEKRGCCVFALFAVVIALIKGANFLVYACLIAIVILCSGQLKEGTGILTKIINWTSDRSYTLYLIHATVFATFQQFYGLGRINKAVYVFAAVVLTLVFTELVYRYVEMPANRLAKKMTLKAQRS